MRLRLNACVALVCLLFTSEALPRKDIRGTELSEIDVADDGGVDGVKDRELEVSESTEVGKWRNGEPTCDELRAMWRFSKRQSRAPEITNEIPTYRDPFAVNVWDDYARPRSAGRTGIPRAPVFGKVVVTLPKGPGRKPPSRVRAFQEVLTSQQGRNTAVAGQRRKGNHHRHVGGGTPAIQRYSQGSFQHLKELIRNERARELQEQRLNEEAERNGGKLSKNGKYQFGHVNESPPPVGNVIRNRIAGGYPTGRRTYNYPVEMLAARYLYDYPNRPFPGPRPGALNNYKLPDSSLVMDGDSYWTW